MNLKQFIASDGPPNQWIREKRATNALRQFYEAIESMIEGDRASQENSQKELDKQTQDDLELAEMKAESDRQIEAGRAQVAAQLAAIDEEKNLLATIRPDEF